MKGILQTTCLSRCCQIRIADYYKVDFGKEWAMVWQLVNYIIVQYRNSLMSLRGYVDCPRHGSFEISVRIESFPPPPPPPPPCSSVVSMSDSWPGVCEFDPRLWRTFFPAYFRLSPLQKHVRKVVSGFRKKSCVSSGVRKPGNTCAHDMTLAVIEALNLITTKQNLYASFD